ncbi:hypothetical protein ACFE6N_22825 [Pedobacter sp. BG31]|uniref:hypothetical protein n=1 Tax=Pedobacter sp. BG31 TaxID=3349697 RepID=UPI0035F4FA45
MTNIKMSRKNSKSDFKRKAIRSHKAFLKSVSRADKFQEFNFVEKKVQQAKIKNDEMLIDNIRESLLVEFESFITPGSGDLIVSIPNIFCLCENYNACILSIKKFASSMFDFPGIEIKLDFSQCIKADTAALFLLQIIRLELIEKLTVLEQKLSYLRMVPIVKSIASKKKDVVRLMLVCGYPVSTEDIQKMEGTSTLSPIHNAGYYKGTASQKHYLENKKSVFATKIVEYFDSYLNHHNYQLTENEKGNIDGIIGEMLSNAEDHSGSNKWFVTANFSKEMTKDGSSDVGEMNLTILSFGRSIYEAFEDTRDSNLENYLLVEKYASNILTNFDTGFTKDQLFTVGTMQDQISRLKFERESRGTGTMKFINSFLELGDYVNESKGFVPNLSIFSGNVQLICDNEFKPFAIDTVKCLSLNPEKDLRKPPRSSHLKKLGQKFPGTLISVKIYINKEHWDKKYGGINNERA